MDIDLLSVFVDGACGLDECGQPEGGELLDRGIFGDLAGADAAAFLEFLLECQLWWLFVVSVSSRSWATSGGTQIYSASSWMLRAQAARRGLYRDEAPGLLGPNLVFNPRHLAAVMPALQVDHLVRDGAAPLVLLKPVVQKKDSDAVHPGWLLGMRTQLVVTCFSARSAPRIEHLADHRGRV